jgi:hypothetical protein
MTTVRSFAGVHQQVPGLPRYPLPRRMRHHTEHVDPAGGDLAGEQHKQPPRQHGADGDQVHRQHARGPRAETA